MKGSLRKQGDNWYAIVDTKDELGKRKQKWYNTKCEKKPDAEKFLRKLLTQKDDNTFIEPSKVKFVDFLQDWLDNVVKTEVESTTWESYKLVIERHLIPYLKEKCNILLQELKPLHIQKYYQYKLKEGRADGKGGLSGNTLRKHHANLRSSLEYASKMEMITLNPADKVVLPKKDKFTGKYYTAEQIEELLNAVKGSKIESAVFITANYGLRRGEVLGLKWDAINFKDGTLTIKETRVKYGTETVTKAPKNESSRRTLPLMEEVSTYLKALRKTQFELKQEFVNEYHDDNYICCWEDGKPIATRYLNQKFKEILDYNGLPMIRFHDLRHSTASYLLKKGISMKEIQIWLGHADIGTTMNLYSHVDMEMKQNAANIINGRHKNISNDENVSNDPDVSKMLVKDKKREITKKCKSL